MSLSREPDGITQALLYAFCSHGPGFFNLIVLAPRPSVLLFSAHLLPTFPFTIVIVLYIENSAQHALERLLHIKLHTSGCEGCKRIV